MFRSLNLFLCQCLERLQPLLISVPLIVNFRELAPNARPINAAFNSESYMPRDKLAACCGTVMAFQNASHAIESGES
jgi:hypothetical protein